ncbi:VOC family protein [Pseudarthrobacter sp. PS3-L1]|uniref:VOC family protein n=1 Tax=Pseudarthrobacter sp. PS3-L1 TaxID=3046207 RepID=UPI0024BBE8F2|nr:VOC family protein [Pseudarthrobacter sp. PS3-L1]MDJ0319925.1 VOC family protein [Pseudarthrobacter sp. PS3-L1]
MKVTPIRFVRDIELANRFYSALGLLENAAATSGTWADMRGGGSQLGLHIAETATTHADAGAVALQFTSDEKLELTTKRLEEAGYTPSEIMDETFGRYFTVKDPDGYLIQVNELDEELNSLSYETRESSALK